MLQYCCWSVDSVDALDDDKVSVSPLLVLLKLLDNSAQAAALPYAVRDHLCLLRVKTPVASRADTRGAAARHNIIYRTCIAGEK